MRKSDFWKSKYIKAEDLGDKPTVLTIKSVSSEMLRTNGREDCKPIIRFEHAQKGLVLNLTNWDTIVDITGEEDTDRWPGHRVELYASTVEVSGETKPCVRIRAPEQGELSSAAKKADVPKSLRGDMDDEIPF